MRISSSIPAAVFAFFGGATAFWRMDCAVVQTGRIDTLVNPGAIAAHAHTIVGGSNFGVNATYESLLNSRCTSCEITADKSAYWTPLLYYEHANGSFEEVPHSGSVVYYLARGVNAANVQPYPKGFKILSGDKAARSYDDDTLTYGNDTYPAQPISNRVSFACLAEGPEPPQTYGLPSNVSSCINGLRAQIQFQACWNGVDLYKSDNSHVAYMSAMDDGVCPPGYPIQLISLFLETDYAPSQVSDNNDGGRYVFSQGDATGYGFHGDFQNGWDEDIQALAVKNCAVADLDGVISECPILTTVDTNGYAYNCPEQPPQVDEQVHGLLDKLPGCITVTTGPAAANASDMECGADITQPTIYTTADSTPVATVVPTASGASFGLSGYKYVGCGNDSAGGTRALNSVFYTNYTAMTVEFCQGYCTGLGYRYSGVEYAQECHCDNAVNPTVVFGSAECNFDCGGSMTADTGSTEVCGGYGYASIYNNTNKNFVAFGNNANSADPDVSAGPIETYAKNYLGCASDDKSVRALSGNSTTFANMTKEYCASFCSADNGYQYYGVEYGTECYCGNALNGGNAILNATSSPSNSTCDMRCPGANLEVCGGPSALSLYNNTAHIAPAVKSPIGRYVSKGCVTDPGTLGRALNGTAMLSSTSMTNEMCVKHCLGNEMHYAGVEYASQCFCGNKIETANGAVAATCETGALMLCSGNIYEYCGGPSLLNIWYSSTL